MGILIAVLIFVAVAGAIFAISSAVFASGSNVGDRLQTMLDTREEAPVDANSGINKWERVFEPLSKAIPQSSENLSETRSMLFQAGFREPAHVRIYLGLRIAAAALLFGLALFTGLLARSLLMGVALPALGYIGSQFVLKRMIKRRQERIQLGLPDALDLTLVCVEAGLSLDQSLDRVGTELRSAHPDLSDELTLLILEIRAGKSRAEALRNLATRTGEGDIRAFVAVLIQTDRFGTSIGDALRIHSESLRTERRQRAEERAAKTTTKMIPALVLFIFPVMFIVILGPVVITLIHEFKQ